MFQALYSFGECVGVLMHAVSLLILVGVAFFTRGIVRTIGHSSERKNNG